MKDRETNEVAVEVIEATDRPTLQGFVADHAEDTAMVFTDGAQAYEGMINHEAVQHSLGEYVDGEVHTNGIESLWAMLKRGIYGTYHHVSEKHAGRYATEFAGRHNNRPNDTIDQVRSVIRGMDGKRLRYQDLTA